MIQRYESSLAGKTAIVTGSTSDIGLGIARAFAGAGMHVMWSGCLGTSCGVETQVNA